MAAELSGPDRERYARQVGLPAFGQDAQAALSGASALVVGAGALGCPAAAYLAAAGVGSIGIVDDGVVTLESVGRALLQLTPDVGANRAESAAAKLGVLNPGVQVDPYPARVGAENAAAIASGHDVVVDCTNQDDSHLALSDACLDLRVPLVIGGTAGLDGWATIVSRGETPCYRCLDPRPEQAEVGAPVGAAGGVIGSLLALEAIKLIAGVGRPLEGRMLLFLGLDGAMGERELRRAGDCSACLEARVGATT